MHCAELDDILGKLTDWGDGPAPQPTPDADHLGDAIATEVEPDTFEVLSPARTALARLPDAEPEVVESDEAPEDDEAAQERERHVAMARQQHQLMREVRAAEDRPPLQPAALTAMAVGRATPEEVARASGVKQEVVEESLATMLRQIPPEEVARALGIQATEQQLKSGAFYGAVVADLMVDLGAGRLKPDEKLKLATLLGKNGKIEPKEAAATGNAGQAFVLNISMGADRPPVVIESGSGQ